MTRRPYLACAGAVIALAAPASATAAPTAVNLRIEGRTTTIFDGPMTSDAKTVHPSSGGAHRCDGRNGSAATDNPTPGPTPITTLDDGQSAGGYTWSGTYFPDFGDYSVDRVGPDPATESEFWGVYVNGVQTTVGGCQYIVRAGDEVLWAFDAFNKAGATKLTGPEAVTTGQGARVRVTDTATGAPVAGAGVGVGGAKTDSNGFATLVYDRPGVYRLKSERPDYVRSRTHTLCVDPPQADPCSTGDKTAPSVRLDVPAIASSLSRFGLVRASWQGDDGAGSGIRRYRVQYRRVDGKGSDWKVLENDTAVTQGAFHGSQGGAYHVRVQAFDKASNASPEKQLLTLVPLDDLSERMSLSPRWRQLKRQGAYERSVSRARAKGAKASLKFTGSRVALITRLTRKAGRVRISVDGKSKLLSLRGKSGFRQVVFRSRKLGAGEHEMTVTTLSRRPAEIDAVAIRP